jgi:hypothetical protein
MIVSDSWAPCFAQKPCQWSHPAEASRQQCYFRFRLLFHRSNTFPRSFFLLRLILYFHWSRSYAALLTHRSRIANCGGQLQCHQRNHRNQHCPLLKLARTSARKQSRNGRHFSEEEQLL